MMGLCQAQAFPMDAATTFARDGKVAHGTRYQSKQKLSPLGEDSYKWIGPDQVVKQCD